MGSRRRRAKSGVGDGAGVGPQRALSPEESLTSPSPSSPFSCSTAGFCMGRMQVLHPAEPHCTSRVAPVRGPRHDAGRELAWVIQVGNRILECGVSKEILGSAAFSQILSPDLSQGAQRQAPQNRCWRVMSRLFYSSFDWGQTGK